MNQSRLQGRSAAHIYDVTPRDGLQIETAFVATAVKAELIRRSAAAGVRRIEAVSFVNPKAVPQLADAEAVLEAVGPLEQVVLVGLVLNARGMQRAVQTSVSEVNGVVVASDTFSRRNQHVSTQDGITVWSEIADTARSHGLTPTVTIGAAFGCPFEGEVPVARVVEIAAQLAETRPAEICLADTIGVAVPSDVLTRAAAVRAVVGDIPLRLHLHDTRHTAIANVVAGLAAGIDTFDCSYGGLGGCPFAPGATGNVALEDVLYLFDRMGVDTGLDLGAALEITRWIETVFGRRLPGAIAHVPTFPVRN